MRTEGLFLSCGEGYNEGQENFLKMKLFLSPVRIVSREMKNNTLYRELQDGVTGIGRPGIIE